MKKSVKKLSAVALASTLVLTACGGANKPATSEVKEATLKVWVPQEDQAPVGDHKQGFIGTALEEFKKANPQWKLTFNVEVMSEADAKTQLLKDVDAAADVFMFANDQIPEMAKAKAISKLGGKTVEDIKANNSESMVGSVTFDNAIYGVPFTPNTYFMFYDKSKFSEEEVKNLNTMMDKNLGEGVTNFAYDIGNGWYLPAFYFSAGGTLFGAQGTDEAAGTNFGDLSKVTLYVSDLVKNPRFAKEEKGSSISKFKEGKLGAYVSGSWDAAAIKDALKENFGATKLPTVTIDGKTGQMKSFAGSKAIGVNAKSKNQEVAVALAAFLGGEKAQTLHYETRGITPTWKSVAGNEAVKKDVVATAQILEIAEASVTQPMVAKMGNFWDPMAALGTAILNGEVTADTAAEITKKAGDAINK